MKVAIAPTITALNPHTYREQMERVMEFAARIHVDYADGLFAPTQMVSPEQSWLPEGYEVDLHVMYRRPAEHMETLISLKPNLVILHAEADGNVIGMMRELKAVGIRAGIGLLQSTQPEIYANEIEEADHVLIFSGSLGHHGGVADLSHLAKVERIKEINPLVEVGWDGGINDENVGKLVQGGINVLDVGGFIHKSDDPKNAYGILSTVVN